MDGELSSGLYFTDVNELNTKSETIINQVVNDALSNFKGSEENITRCIESLRNRLCESYNYYENEVQIRNREEAHLKLVLCSNNSNNNISLQYQDKFINLLLSFKGLIINPNNITKSNVISYREYSTGVWNQNRHKDLIIDIEFKYNKHIIQKRFTVEERTKLPRPEAPTAPFDLEGTHVYREKYHGVCGYTTHDMKKGERLYTRVEYGHHWRWYPERSKYAVWDGSEYPYRVVEYVR